MVLLVALGKLLTACWVCFRPLEQGGKHAVLDLKVEVNVLQMAMMSQLLNGQHQSVLCTEGFRCKRSISKIHAISTPDVMKGGTQEIRYLCVNYNASAVIFPHIR